MREFIHDRQELLETIPQFADPDFAQPERLPVDARLPGDPDELEEEWKKSSSRPLGHMTPGEWDQCHCLRRSGSGCSAGLSENSIDPAGYGQEFTGLWRIRSHRRRFRRVLIGRQNATFWIGHHEKI